MRRNSSNVIIFLYLAAVLLCASSSADLLRRKENQPRSILCLFDFVVTNGEKVGTKAGRAFSVSLAELHSVDLV